MGPEGVGLEGMPCMVAQFPRGGSNASGREWIGFWFEKWNLGPLNQYPSGIAMNLRNHGNECTRYAPAPETSHTPDTAFPSGVCTPFGSPMSTPSLVDHVS